jgi:hypothetical protein
MKSLSSSYHSSHQAFQATSTIQAHQLALYSSSIMHFTSFLSIVALASVAFTWASPFPIPDPAAAAAGAVPTITVQRQPGGGVYTYNTGGIQADSTMGFPIVTSHSSNGQEVDFWLQSSDGNFVARNHATHAPLWASAKVVSNSCGGKPCECGRFGGDCRIQFQQDGNLVVYFNSTPVWYTGTGAGHGAYAQFWTNAPYIVILNSLYQPIWASS